jgi:de-etiolated-1
MLLLTTEVKAVFENTSEQLLELFESNCDMFRNATLDKEAQFTCSPSSNIYALRNCTLMRFYQI